MPHEAWPDERPAAIAWDLDGTLVDSAGDLRTALNEVLVVQGLEPCSLGAVRGMIGHGVARLIMRGFAASGRELNAAQLRDIIPEFMRYYARVAVNETRPFPGVRDTLQRLHGAGIPQVVCTNKPEAVSRHILEGLGLDGLFAGVTGGDTTARPKPDPLPLQTGLGQLGAELSRCLMIGDSETDVATARAAGVPVAVVGWGYSQVLPETLGADYFLDDLFSQQPRWLA